MADFFDKMMVGINKGAASISEGSKNMMEKAKINSAIHDAEKEKAKLAELLGVQAYNLYFAGVALPEELHNFCLEMKKRDDAIAQQQENLRALEARKTGAVTLAEGGKQCACGNVNKPDAVFCAQCGKDLSSAVAENSNACACGYVNKPGAAFCAQCGAKIN